MFVDEIDYEFKIRDLAEISAYAREYLENRDENNEEEYVTIKDVLLNTYYSIYEELIQAGIIINIEKDELFSSFSKLKLIEILRKVFRKQDLINIFEQNTDLSYDIAELIHNEVFDYEEDNSSLIINIILAFNKSYPLNENYNLLLTKYFYDISNKEIFKGYLEFIIDKIRENGPPSKIILEG